MDQSDRIVALTVAGSGRISTFATVGYGQWAPAGRYRRSRRGEARVWFYRNAGPYDSQEQPYIEMNGAIVGVSQPLGYFFIDVKPGFYHVTVQQYLNSPEEAANINLVPGQRVYLRIVSLTDCIAGGGSLRSPGYSRRASISGTYRPRLRKQTQRAPHSAAAGDRGTAALLS